MVLSGSTEVMSASVLLGIVFVAMAGLIRAKTQDGQDAQ